MIKPTAPRPDWTDMLASLPLGLESGAPLLPATAGTPTAELRAAIRPALERPPCFVAFSGGRDSSGVLALAVDEARHRGLEEPVPVIMRYPGPDTQEEEWQHLVVDHLGLSRVEILELTDELDLVGDLATSVLARHGVVWPANAHAMVPMLEVARGGALITGVGGDELLGSHCGPLTRIARGRRRPRRGELRPLAKAALPRPLKARVLRRSLRPAWPGMRERAADRVAAALARDEARMPDAWDASTRYWTRSRAYAAERLLLPELGAERDVLALSPLLEPAFVTALTRAGGPLGFGSRDAAMCELFADILPEQILVRRGKASFGSAFWGPRTREFAHSWRGDGLNDRDVDVDALRTSWLSDQPDFRTALVLHQAWVSTAVS